MKIFDYFKKKVNKFSLKKTPPVFKRSNGEVVRYLKYIEAEKALVINTTDGMMKIPTDGLIREG